MTVQGFRCHPCPLLLPPQDPLTRQPQPQTHRARPRPRRATCASNPLALASQIPGPLPLCTRDTIMRRKMAPARIPMAQKARAQQRQQEPRAALPPPQPNRRPKHQAQPPTNPPNRHRLVARAQAGEHTALRATLSPTLDLGETMALAHRRAMEAMAAERGQLHAPTSPQALVWKKLSPSMRWMRKRESSCFSTGTTKYRA